MQDTQLSFIYELTDGSDESWIRLSRVYSPLIRGYLTRFHFGNEDIADITQEVLLAVHKNIDGFEHNGRVGAFRSWVRTITVNSARSFLRKNPRGRTISFEDETRELLNQLADDSSRLTAEFNRQHDGFFVEMLLDRVADECDPETIEVFRLYALQGMDPNEIARSRGIARSAVYVTKSRVMRRLKSLAQDYELT